MLKGIIVHKVRYIHNCIPLNYSQRSDQLNHCLFLNSCFRFFPRNGGCKIKIRESGVECKLAYLKSLRPQPITKAPSNGKWSFSFWS